MKSNNGGKVYQFFFIALTGTKRSFLQRSFTQFGKRKNELSRGEGVQHELCLLRNPCTNCAGIIINIFLMLPDLEEIDAARFFVLVLSRHFSRGGGPRHFHLYNIILPWLRDPWGEGRKETRTGRDTQKHLQHTPKKKVKKRGHSGGATTYISLLGKTSNKKRMLQKQGRGAEGGQSSQGKEGGAVPASLRGFLCAIFTGCGKKTLLKLKLSLLFLVASGTSVSVRFLFKQKNKNGCGKISI